MKESYKKELIKYAKNHSDLKLEYNQLKNLEDLEILYSKTSFESIILFRICIHKILNEFIKFIRGIL